MQTTMRPPMRPPSTGAAPPARQPKTFGRSRGTTRAAHRLMIYGTGGVGKTSLAAAAPAPVFADLEGGSKDLDVERVDGIENWADLRAWLQSGDFDGVQTVVIDSGTRAEEWCVRHVVENVRTDKGAKVETIEGYGFGKGYVYVFEEWRRFLADLEAHYNKGRNVVLVCHDRIGKVPNPSGDDYIRHEPRLQSSEKASVMLATKEWCDHVLFIGYDVAAKDGKAKGSGTRTIYTVEEATHMAKCRGLDGTPILYERGGVAVWQALLGARAQAVDDMPM